MSKTLHTINQSIWELQEKIQEYPHELGLRKDLLQFFHDSMRFVERRSGIAEEKRSFLMLQEREAICCLLIHGAGGSPLEMKPLGEYLFKLGYTVYGIKLPLNPKSSDSLLWEYFRGRKRRNKGPGESNSWSVCLAQSRIVLETLLSYSSSTYLIGFSFGGTLALDLTRTYPVPGTVLVSPGIYPSRRGGYLLFRLWKTVLPTVARDISPVKSTLVDFLERTRSGFEPLDSPVLVIQAADDPAISVRGFNFLKRHCTNRKSNFVLLDKGGHLLLQGEQSEKVFGLCGDFIKSL
ncbi:MAG: hypothetical protein JXB45_07445 [Candidatus Krumholzibacteriota bacterium]|nr:hypothetical protein [Candidatus Krumholzibacteriota bacterium]